MESGRKVLGRIDASLRSAREQLGALDKELATSAQALAHTHRARAQILKRIARIRLDGIGSGEVSQALDAADYEARQALAQREDAISALAGEIDEAEARLRNLESEREASHQIVDEHAQALARLEASVQSNLEADPEFQAVFEASRQADAVADAAAEKTALAENDRDEKGEPYRTDPLFIYLWERNYGTSDYQANSLTRFLDGWVARLCSYDEARPNYWMLLEIPKRLSEHTQSLREEAEAKLTALVDLETAASDAAGVGVAQQELADAEADQDAIDERINGVEKRLDVLFERRGRFATGDDEFVTRGVTAISSAMHHHRVEQLLIRSRETSSAEDDQLARELADIRDREQDVEDEIAEHRRIHASHLKQVKELEQVRANFKRQRFDDLRSGFANSPLIATLIGEVLRGAIQGAQAWDTMKRQQKYRDVDNAWPDFGSGGMLKRRNRKGPWHWPGDSGSDNQGRSGGGFKLPKSGGRGRSKGGFRTGGGF